MLLGSAAINHALANKIVSNILFLFWSHCLNKSVELYIVWLNIVTVSENFLENVSAPKMGPALTKASAAGLNWER